MRAKLAVSGDDLISTRPSSVTALLHQLPIVIPPTLDDCLLQVILLCGHHTSTPSIML